MKCKAIFAQVLAMKCLCYYMARHQKMLTYEIQSTQPFESADYTHQPLRRMTTVTSEIEYRN